MGEKSSSSAREWTPAQRAAIAHDAGDVLVSAAAGSGKTAVLAERCARLVCETAEGGSGGSGGGGGRERCGVENLLVLTFTEAAANEMRSRIAEAIREKSRATKHDARNAQWLRRQAAMVDRAGISTLHAFCARVLRAHFHEAKIDPGFEIIDAEEAALLREEVLETLIARRHELELAGGEGGGDAGFTHFFEAYARGRDATCRDAILRLHEMLASTADPEKFRAAARDVYTGDGSKTFDAYLKHVVCEEIRLAAMTAARACADVRRIAGKCDMLTWLERIAADLVAAHESMCAKGAAVWPAIRASLNQKWPPCKTLEHIDNFEGLKAHAWKGVKDRVDRIHKVTLAADPDVMRRELPTLAAPLETLLGLAHDFETQFTAAKRAQNRVDFHDLERLTLELLSRTPSLAVEELRSRYHYLLVDEFQDINPLQAALLNHVRSPLRFGNQGEGGGNLFVVGDVKQSIYGFRLAEPDLFLELEKNWRATGTGGGAGGVGGGRVIALQENFRSQARLLSAMNGVFERVLEPTVAGVHYADGHALVPGTKSEPPAAGAFDGTPIEVHLVVMDHGRDEAADKKKRRDDDDEGEGSLDREPPPENLSAVEHEARMVADRIAALLEEKRVVRTKEGPRPLQKRDIAILLRTMKNKGMVFAQALARRGIAAHADLSAGFFDTPEVRDTLALLAVLDNPRQDVPLAAVMLGPYGGFTHDDLALIRLTFDVREVGFAMAASRYGNNDAQTAVQDVAPHAPPHSAALAQRLNTFFARLATWRDRLHARPLHEGLADIYTESRILVYVAGLEAGTQRVANLQMLHQRALKFATFRKQGLHRFLRFIQKLREQETDLGEAPVLSDASDVVRIMSVHKSKGLEFPVVFVSGLGSRLKLWDPGPAFVHRKLGVAFEVIDLARNIYYPSAASLRVTSEGSRVRRAEELRLLYVAMTRARDHLVLTGHLEKGATLPRVRRQWAAHEGPLPEDVLLRANTPLEWLLPALACGGAAQCGGLRVDWLGVQSNPQVQITVHGPGAAPPAHVEVDPEAAAHAARAEKIRAASPLANDVAADAPVERLLARVTGVYPHESAAQNPAVQTVTFLKTLADHDTESDEMAAAIAYEMETIAADESPMPRDPAAGERARQRGIATHRIMELLDLAAIDSAAAVDAQIATLVQAQAISAEETARADIAGIRWMLTESVTGRRLIAAARAHATGRLTLRRELPFTWTGTLAESPGDPADWPTIRGVIDAVVVDDVHHAAEIFDYKTDAAFLFESRLPDYRRQMKYYLRAASEILGYPVARATLVFLDARLEVEVNG